MARREFWLGAAAVATGLVAQQVAYDWTDVRHWLPDLLTGWLLVGSGLAGWRRRPDSHVGALLVVTGFTWFLGNFAPLLGAFGVAALFVHRGVVVHTLIAYPTGRLRDRYDAAAVVAGYLVALAMPVWNLDVATVTLAGFVVATGAWSYTRAPGRYRQARALALQAATGLAIVLIGGVMARLAVPSGTATYPALLAYELALCAVAAALAAGLFSASWERAAVAELVIELGDSRGAAVDGALAWVLGDPALRVGFWQPELAAFADQEGRPVTAPAESDGQVMTVVEQDGQPVGAVIHDPVLRQDAGVMDAVVSAVRLAASNAALRTDVQRQAAEVRASRLRLLRAADDEGRRLELRLRRGAERSLDELAGLLGRARNVATSEQIKKRIDGTREELGRTVDELLQLARGLHPTVLAECGLRAAVEELAARCPIPVDIDVTDGPLPRVVEKTVYFVCAEALTNAAKHSGASRVNVVVSSVDDRVRVSVRDDGVGAAATPQGSGLQGLADRVDATGGRFIVESRTGQGTLVAAEIPLKP